MRSHTKAEKARHEDRRQDQERQNQEAKKEERERQNAEERRKATEAREEEERNQRAALAAHTAASDAEKFSAVLKEARAVSAVPHCGTQLDDEIPSLHYVACCCLLAINMTVFRIAAIGTPISGQGPVRIDEAFSPADASGT